MQDNKACRGNTNEEENELQQRPGLLNVVIWVKGGPIWPLESTAALLNEDIMESLGVGIETQDSIIQIVTHIDELLDGLSGD